MKRRLILVPALCLLATAIGCDSRSVATPPQPASSTQASTANPEPPAAPPPAPPTAAEKPAALAKVRTTPHLNSFELEERQLRLRLKSGELPKIAMPEAPEVPPALCKPRAVPTPMHPCYFAATASVHPEAVPDAVSQVAGSEYNPQAHALQREQAIEAQIQQEQQSLKSSNQSTADFDATLRGSTTQASTPPVAPHVTSVNLGNATPVGEPPKSQQIEAAQSDVASMKSDVAAPQIAEVTEAISADETANDLLKQSPGTPAIVSAYPNIEAPDTIAPNQEIAVQVSLSDQQLAPETQILSGTQTGGKLQLQMQTTERQWTLTVNLSAPGLELTRGTNTEEITVTRDGNSTVAAFYMRPKLGPNGELPAMLNTRILATLLHDGAFVARLARPITITPARPTLAAAPATPQTAPALQPPVAQIPAPRIAMAMAAAAAKPAPATSQLDLTADAPSITIVENRINNLLRINLFLANQEPILIDIDDATSLHTWINAHFAQMAQHGRGIGEEDAPPQEADLQSGSDYLTAFGNELYDRIVPDAQKAVLFQALHSSQLHSIQVFSDDPSIPWELMRPLDPATRQRQPFLGESISIARWPMMHKGLLRPRQTMTLAHSIVVAPQYAGAMQLADSKLELTTLLKTPTFQQVDGSYTLVRQIAANPPHGIVHFAGHGDVSQQNGVAQYQILLKDGAIGPEAWAALNTTDSLAGTLYFFNACDVGTASQFMNEVDGWAPALLGTGANGYIGALWPISDSTANLFAATFYQQLTQQLAASAEGATIASVIASTRQHVFDQTHDPTALAYVFYGNPQLRIVSAPQ